MKESSQRLENLEEEVNRLHSNNEGLSETVLKLQEEIQRLREENKTLKRRLSDSVDEELEILKITAPSVLLNSDADFVRDLETEAGNDDDKIPHLSDTSDSPTTSLRRGRSRKQRLHPVKRENEIASKFL